MELLSNAEQLSGTSAHGISHSSCLGVIFQPNGAFNRDSHQSLQGISQIGIHGSGFCLRTLDFALSLLRLTDDRLGLITAHAQFSLLFQLDQFSLLLLQVQKDLLINDRLRLAQVLERPGQASDKATKKPPPKRGLMGFSLTA
ncbi:MAG: hypothetical protein VXA52_09260 [Synechococcus sp.]